MPRPGSSWIHRRLVFRWAPMGAGAHRRTRPGPRRPPEVNAWTFQPWSDGIRDLLARDRPRLAVRTWHARCTLARSMAHPSLFPPPRSRFRSPGRSFSPSSCGSRPRARVPATVAMMIDERIDSPDAGARALDRPRHGLRARGLRPASLALVFAVTLAGCRGEPALLRQAHKEELIGAIQRDAARVRRGREERRPRHHRRGVRADGARGAGPRGEDRSAARRAARADRRGRQAGGGRDASTPSTPAGRSSRAVDERLLALAVANTNLKAARLSAREGLAAVDRLVDALGAMQRASTDPETIRSPRRRVGRGPARAVPAPDPHPDRGRRGDDAARAADGRARRIGRAHAGEPARCRGTSRQTRCVAASEAWTEHRRIAAEVVRLSRENTNVRSFDVSVHEKRKVTARVPGRARGIARGRRVGAAAGPLIRLRRAGALVLRRPPAAPRRCASRRPPRPCRGASS